MPVCAALSFAVALPALEAVAVAVLELVGLAVVVTVAVAAGTVVKAYSTSSPPSTNSELLNVVRPTQGLLAGPVGTDQS